MPQRGVPFSSTYEAVDRTTGAYITGDVANHAILFALDGVETSPANAPTELSRGEYAILLTAGEMSAASITVYGASSTNNVLIIPTRFSTDVNSIPESAPANAIAVAPGGTYSFPFFTRNAALALVNADSTPTLTVYRNYASTMLVCTLGHQGTGQYNGSMVLGSPWVNGDTGYVLVNATVSGVALTEAFFFTVETDNPGSLANGTVATIASASHFTFTTSNTLNPDPGLPGMWVQFDGNVTAGLAGIPFEIATFTASSLTITLASTPGVTPQVGDTFQIFGRVVTV